MALVEYPPHPVADPVTGQLREELYGKTILLVEHGTDIPLTGLVEWGSGAPVSNPVTVSAIGKTPWVAKEDGPLRIDAVSGDFRTYLWSPTGAMARMDEAALSADQSQAAAEQAAQSAQNAAALVGAPADEAVAAMVDNEESLTGAAVRAVAGTGSGGGGSVDWGSIPEKPAEGTLLGDGDAVEVVENVAAGTTTVRAAGRLSQAGLSSTFAQADYVGRLSALSNYDRMTVKRTASNNTLRITCWAPNGHTVAYDITWNARYQYVGTIYGSTGESSGTYELAQARGYPQDITLGGTYVSVGAGIAAGYTTTVGATFQTTPITTRTANAQVNVSTTVDNRGGVWNIALAEAPSVTGSFSVWNATTTIRTHTAVLTVPEPGTYTLVATFAGADPLNAPAGGVPARGWLVGPDNSNAPTFVAVHEPAPVLTRLSQVSNKDFAFKIKPATGGDYEFVPWHGTDSEAFASPTVYLIDGAPVDLSTFPIGQNVDVSTFEIAQNIYGRNTATGTANIIEVWTKQRFTPDGTYSVTGRWKTLVDIVADNATFPLMLPADMPLFNEVASSTGRGYLVTPAMATANLWSLDDDQADGYVTLSPTTDFVAAVRYNNRAETLRVGQPNKPAPGENTFIELRTGGTMLKIYTRLYGADTPVPAGSVHRFSGDYWFGAIPGAHDVLSVL